MNFQRFYTNAKNRLTDAALSLWATGEAGMQTYLTSILDKERLLSEEVVVQSAFPWEPALQKFEETTDVFDIAFIKALNNIKDPEFRFPAGRHPYKHQVESWRSLLVQNKSIAVTTGTGSGKTECFMLPVLHDLYQNCRNENGVNAVFLYPLNALIGSQRKRMHAWCKALGGIRYAVYNGQTDEDSKALADQESFPEIISRKRIRETPPQILFTNPSMLEYILVRNKDVPLLKNSQGKLRWILLDEAHTLTGSAASEMALLIRRVADAFGVETKALRFAITSATVGSDPDSFQRLQDFMALLCGIPKENIVVIKGDRVLPQVLPKPTQSVKQLTDLLQTAAPETFHQVHLLRNTLLKQNALPLSQMGELLKIPGTMPDRLRVLDALCERSLEDKSILPVRAHFFARGVSGIWVCTNRDCPHQTADIPVEAIGTMTTIAGTLCRCGSPVFELVACRSCGHQLLEAEKIIDNEGREKLKVVSAVVQDAFQFDPQEAEEAEFFPEHAEEPYRPPQRFYFTRCYTHLRMQHAVEPFSLNAEAALERGGADFVCLNDGSACPHCDSDLSSPNHFRLSSAFINRVLADVFLEQTPVAERLTGEMLWQGHKYISFTDSRQGTARISALINQDNEARWIRSQVYHKLGEKMKQWKDENTTESYEELQAAISLLEAELFQTTIPLLKKRKEKAIQELKEQLSGTVSFGEKAVLTWKELKEYVLAQPDFEKLFKGNNPDDANPSAREHYLTAILYDQFARRLPLQRSLENLGMVSLVYPRLQKTPLPAVAQSLKITDTEWRDLLKIAADYAIRYPFHFSLPDAAHPYTTSFLRSSPIYNPDAREVNVAKWRRFDKTRPNRFSLLICAGLGYHNVGDIDAETEDRLNVLLEEIWKTLKREDILSSFGEGFKLNLETASAFRLSEKVWLCPVKRRLIDAHFRGYSPWIKGWLTSDNIAHYKIKQEVEMPLMPYPFNQDAEKTLQMERTREWMISQSNDLRKKGVWNNLHEQVILNQPLYLAGEHSAQQTDHRLKALENDFEKGKLNILNCSTTMEMGVDIGGISTVVMNNVPPAPANYLQRAGRAGRRAEAKSTAFTICAPNPVGLQVMADPMWALKHKIAPPGLSFQSSAVIARHVNAFFLGRFVQTDAIQGINVRMQVDEFFLKENARAVQFLAWLQDGSADPYKGSLARILQNTPWHNQDFSFLLSQVVHSFDRLSEATKVKHNAFTEKLKETSESFGDKSPTYRAVTYQKHLFEEKNAISYLVEEGFLPSAGLPTGIVEFDTLTVGDLDKRKMGKAKKSSKPSYFITRALSEFAPGRNVVIDGKSYRSAGIILKDDRGKQADREAIQSCRKCGYQRIIATKQDQAISNNCPHCEGQNTFAGLAFKSKHMRGGFTEMIQPAGFAVDIYQKPCRNLEDQTGTFQYIDPLLINVKPWPPESNALYEIRDSEENGEIVFYNTGAGDGYAVCLHCGRTTYNKDGLKDHKRLRGGKGEEQASAYCSGNESSHGIKEHVILGGRFRTDYCELRLREANGPFVQDNSLLYTLGAILSKELAHYLTVEADEIGFGIKKYDTFSTIFFFDTAKGGAGYSSQLSTHLAAIIPIAEQRLVCECDTACTKCLIDRNTQWHLPQLDRKMALAWLQKAADVKVPEALLAHYPDLQIGTTQLRNALIKEVNANRVARAFLYVSAHIASWSPSDLAILETLRRKVEVNLVFPDFPENLPEDEQLTLVQCLAWSTLWQSKLQKPVPLKVICRLELRDGDVLEYLTEDFESDLNSSWGNLKNATLYLRKAGPIETLSHVRLNFNKQNIHEIALQSTSPIPSDKLADLVLDGISDRQAMQKAMGGKKFSLVYQDRYLKTPFGLLLLVQFVGRLREVLGFELISFSLQGQDFTQDKPASRIWHSYPDGQSRNQAFLSFAVSLKVPDLKAENVPLPHFRSFEFTEANGDKIIIRPDGGIEYGWAAVGETAKLRFATLSPAEKPAIQIKDDNPILYTISIQKLS